MSERIDRTASLMALLAEFPAGGSFDLSSEDVAILQAALAAPAAPEAPSFGVAIREARVAAGLSLRQAAAMLNTTAVALGEVERMTDRAVARADGAAPEAPLSVEPDAWLVEVEDDEGWHRAAVRLDEQSARDKCKMWPSPLRVIPLYRHPTPAARQPGADADEPPEVIETRLSGTLRPEQVALPEWDAEPGADAAEAGETERLRKALCEIEDYVGSSIRGMVMMETETYIGFKIRERGGAPVDLNWIRLTALEGLGRGKRHAPR